MLKYKPIYWFGIKPFLKKSLSNYFDKKEVTSILLKTKVEYQHLLNQTYDTGVNNPMSSNLYFMLIFLALYKANPNTINKELLKKILHEDILSNNPLLKLSGGRL